MGKSNKKAGVGDAPPATQSKPGDDGQSPPQPPSVEGKKMVGIAKTTIKYGQRLIEEGQKFQFNSEDFDALEPFLKKEN